jgi:hypothetical protein
MPCGSEARNCSFQSRGLPSIFRSSYWHDDREFLFLGALANYATMIFAGTHTRSAPGSVLPHPTDPPRGSRGDSSMAHLKSRDLPITSRPEMARIPKHLLKCPPESQHRLPVPYPASMNARPWKRNTILADLGLRLFFNLARASETLGESR